MDTKTPPDIRRREGPFRYPARLNHLNTIAKRAHFSHVTAWTGEMAMVAFMKYCIDLTTLIGGFC
jgi:hypothetical protein